MLKQRFDKLSELYGTLNDCHFTLNYYVNSSPITYQEYKEQVQSQVEAFFHAKIMAEIYFDEECKSAMQNVLGTFRQVSNAIWLNLPDDQFNENKNSFKTKDSNPDLEWFVKSYDEAIKWLQKELNPEVYKEFLRKVSS